MCFTNSSKSSVLKSFWAHNLLTPEYVVYYEAASYPIVQHFEAGLLLDFGFAALRFLPAHFRLCYNIEVAGLKLVQQSVLVPVFQIGVLSVPRSMPFAPDPYFFLMVRNSCVSSYASGLGLRKPSLGVGLPT